MNAELMPLKQHDHQQYYADHLAAAAADAASPGRTTTKTATRTTIVTRRAIAVCVVVAAVAGVTYLSTGRSPRSPVVTMSGATGGLLRDGSTSTGTNVLDNTSSDAKEAEFVPPFEFVNQCTYDITVRGALGTGSQNCEIHGNCFTNYKGTTATKLLPEVHSEDGNTLFFSTKSYTDQGQPSRTSCRGLGFCAAIGIYDDKSKGRPSSRRRIFNFINQYSYGIPIGVQFNDNDGPIEECPEANLEKCIEDPSLCYSTKGQSDNCYHNAMDTCPDSAWKVKSPPDDQVVWCLTNDQTLGVISARQDNPPLSRGGRCSPAPSDWVSLAGFPNGEPLCKYNTDLYTSALELPGLVVALDVALPHHFTPLNSHNADIVKTARPGGAKQYQAAVNAGCDQFATQKIAGAYPYSVAYEPNGRNVVAAMGKKKDHAVAAEGDQFYQYKLSTSPGDQTPMMAGNLAIQCTEQDFAKVTVTFCPTGW